MAEYFIEWYKELPLLTKVLFFIYLTTSIIAEFFPWFFIHMTILFGSNTILISLISFLYFNRFLSVSFWYELVLFLCYSKSLEIEYAYPSGRKSYFFCLLFGILLILFLSRLRPVEAYKFSQSFVFYIIYLYNNYKNPNGTTAFTPALFVDNKYMVILLIFVNAIFGTFLWTEYFVGLSAGYVFMKLEQVGFIRAMVNVF